MAWCHLPRVPLLASGVTLLALSFLLAGCGEQEPGIGMWRMPLTAVCTIDVTGKGVKQVETDYIPHVVACENGNADTEALKAQAVAARAYMYYKSKSSGAICDGTSCQVYTCTNLPTAKHYAAAQATAGQVLMYSGVVICSFYVAGAKPSTSTCKALSSDYDPTGTEKYVTYNEGLTGSQVHQSTLGWVSPTNYYNRGCKSQNGAHCLSLQGKKYSEILKFYYGADIQLVTATGPCVNPPADAGPYPDSKPPPPPPDSKPPPLQDGRPSAKDSQPSLADRVLRPDRSPSTKDGAAGESGPPIYPGSPAQFLDGGCSIGGSRDQDRRGGGGGPLPAWMLLAGALGAALTRRRA